MDLFDVNVLIYAHRADSTMHAAVRPWFEDRLNGDAVVGMSDLVLSGFIRVVTNSKVFKVPMPVERAIEEAQRIRARPNCIPINPGPGHFDIFTRLCRETEAEGNLVADAYLAALSIEHGCTWWSFGGDFARFPELRWSRPPTA